MTTHLTYRANQSRLDDLRRVADGRRALRRGRSPRAGATSGRVRTDTHTTAPVAVRRATEADRPALEMLAALDTASPPSGEVLIAEVGGEPRAAIEIASGATIADPFRPTVHLVELLTSRADRLRDGADSPRWLRLRSRSAYRTA